MPSQGEMNNKHALNYLTHLYLHDSSCLSHSGLEMNERTAALQLRGTCSDHTGPSGFTSELLPIVCMEIQERCEKPCSVAGSPHYSAVR